MALTRAGAPVADAAVRIDGDDVGERESVSLS